MSRDVLRIAAFVAALVLLYAVAPVDALRALLDVDALRARAADGGAAGLLGFLGVVIVLSVLTAAMMLPTVAGAALYGPVVGPLLATVGVTIGAIIQFVVARYSLRGPAERLLLRRVPVLRDAIEERGLGLLIFLRYLWFPGVLINLGTALSRMPMRTFLLGFPAVLPQAFLVAVVTDAVVTFGWQGIPPLRWAVIVSLAAGSLSLYLVSIRRWPHLAALRGLRGAEEP